MEVLACALEIKAQNVQYTPEGDLTFEMVGVPFRGPVDGNKDLEGHTFSKATDLGPLKEYVVMLDHGAAMEYFQQELREAGASDDQIAKMDLQSLRRDLGIARKLGSNDDGFIFQVLVNRHVKYIKALEAAVKANILKGSIRGFSPVINKSTGHIDYVAGVELSLTPTPMNVFAGIVQKSVEEIMPTNEEKKDVQQQPTPPEQKTEEAANPVGEITKAVEGLIPEPKQEEAAPTELQKAHEEIAALKIQVEQLQSALTKSFDSLSADIKTAFPALVKAVVANLEASISTAVTSEVKKSKLEFTVPVVSKSAPTTNSANGSPQFQMNQQAIYERLPGAPPKNK